MTASEKAESSVALRRNLNIFKKFPTPPFISTTGRDAVTRSRLGKRELPHRRASRGSNAAAPPKWPRAGGGQARGGEGASDSGFPRGQPCPVRKKPL